MTKAKQSAARLATAKAPNMNFGRGYYSDYGVHTPRRLNDQDCQEFGLPVRMEFNRAMNDHYND